MVEASIPRYYTLEEREHIAPTYQVRNDYNTYQTNNTPIVIDNGSSQCRAGWATEHQPFLIFDNIVSKYRDRRINESILAVGYDALADPAGKSNARSPFDSNIVSDFEKMEHIIDYIFVMLGINTSTVNHPIVMTEAPCVPQYTRTRMNELLFENYNIPSVAYGIDSLFSYHYNHHNNSTDDGGIIISSGNNTTHVIPVLSNGKGLLAKTRRISYGGTQASDYMLKLMQLKYPTFPTKMSLTQATELVHHHTFVAQDYQATLKKLEKKDTMGELDRIIQFPFTAPITEEKTLEELQRQAAKREENARRLREAAARSRLEKLVAREQQLEAFTNMKNAKGTIKKSEWNAQLKEAGFKDEADLDDTIQQLEKQIQRARNKELGIEEVEEEKKPPVTTLVDIPDEQLDENERKEKRKQKLMKANYDARQRAKKAKEEARLLEEERQRLEEEKRLNDPETWINEIKEKRDRVVKRIRQRKRLASELSDRRSRASQLRMKNIAHLASDAPSTTMAGNKRRRRGGNNDEDTFGQDDEDWAIYREINRDDESDEEEEDMSELNQYESLLLQYDPNFLPEHRYESQSSPTNTLIHLLARGVYPTYDPQDLEQSYQLHVNIERVRVPEVLFQPNIIGLDQAGLIETVQDIVKSLDPASTNKNAMMGNIFLTGGYSKVPGLQERIHASLQSIYPVHTKIHVHRARDPILDAWKGAAMFAQDSTRKQYFITRKEYLEYGSEYIKEHGLGNIIQK